MQPADDARWLAAAAALAERARPLASPNPGVGALIVGKGVVVGRGWTMPGGRPHAEALALEAAGKAARGATLYVTLEPCAHRSTRGPACADLVAEARLARVVIGMRDPDPRTAGDGISRLEAAGAEVRTFDWPAEKLGLAGHAAWLAHSRPHVTLKLAMSLDGCIATSSGESQWITGKAARTHTHRERARADAILVGGGTLRADSPRLDVRLPGLEDRSPARIALTSGDVPEGWQAIRSPQDIAALEGVRYLMVEGGAQTASAFLAAGLLDRLLVYRAPVLLGGGTPAIGDIGHDTLEKAFAQGLTLQDRRQLGSDTLEVYQRA
ncbi:bifunctional diaminohydroxyphosphoribosylaminopyrimidine deaminase/5-amino-6-(5-phosphoribosylamino)uracil reductase RibD [Aurantiacibacter poecillastricola]|uniref:bifunctional diaminohydroxyphosphoribosylaminopyrimidine deaminase/5-amino-6-(5-phosphoribosylamino)uracil reductase RibD n=1 Tax=Aurantiacibacter poecillastricola TaxID=3064385 RepID=UPI00273EB441|nr:bifunctional diaminohydroxyphosphoribosylaminopyrimidine deaminase/5-amino-6-(5-phosphoribosylamino)uracil reductase RibD [Aurantiacibacter sp. 219JJ12-13]MDP5263196.1 bifunctional diaminohydroxyphosphoribosylaminopyrimidine deaminase/5-amino-6-(5-phosphoribosylamino)uracil reductase RibD [Aurantiacibacter sp. 219JJ12-13]